MTRPTARSRSRFAFRELTGLALVAAVVAAAALSPAHAADGSVAGKLIFWRTSKIATPVMGVIASLPVRVGDQVKQGDVLAEIDTRQLKADLAIAERALEFAKRDLVSEEAKLALEVTEYERQARLKDSPAFSGARFQDASNRVAVARADVEAARSTIATREAEVAKRELDVRLATIAAPFDGIVVRHLLTVGGLVSIETPHILVLVDNTAPEIEAEVPVEQVPVLTVGREVEVAIGGAGREPARIRAVLPSDVPGSATRRVRLELKAAATRPYADSEPVTVYLPTS
jgi:macrolide-specific efflux system membrane fusion protein